MTQKILTSALKATGPNNVVALSILFDGLAPFYAIFPLNIQKQAENRLSLI
jgi:hypothetical protein